MNILKEELRRALGVVGEKIVNATGKDRMVLEDAQAAFEASLGSIDELEQQGLVEVPANLRAHGADDVA